MSLRSLLSGLLVMAGAHAAAGQAIDSVFVEVYNVQEDSVAGGPPLVTYRIFVDLAAGCKLQMVYGSEKHELYVSTTTDFFNDKEHGERYAHRIRASELNMAPLALDSWLTIGAASDSHWGVPRSMDTDGSILECPPYPRYPVTEESTGHAHVKPLCAQDGLMKCDSVREVVNFKYDPGYLGKTRGYVLHTTNGAWAVLGGMMGPTPENILLIAQITTTGELAFKFNLQIKPPGPSEPVLYVSDPPVSENEIYFKGLLYGSRRW